MERELELKNSMVPVVMLSFALGLRQMSMTMVMPFISTYCRTLKGYTPILAGLALGIFGLMQAGLQIPFGIFSDRYGNKKMVLIGLIMVVIGLVTAYAADNIYLLIFARALQGSGAVIGVAYSWIAGMTDRSRRTNALSILGAFISVAAALAFALGPLLRGIMNVNQMFIACAILLSCNILYILIFLKDTGAREPSALYQNSSISGLLRNRTFVLMNLAAFINNFLMVSVFYAMPVYLDNLTGQNGMWKVFVPAIAAAVFIMKKAVPFVDKGYSKQVLIAAFLLLSLSMLLYFNKSSLVCLLAGTSLFMGGYVTLATVIATDVNNVVQDSCRGKANGVFNSFQYIGNFFGSIVTAALWSVSDKLAWIVLIAIGAAGGLMIAAGKPSAGISKESEVQI